MRDYVICTESFADLPMDFISVHNLGFVNSSYMIDGVTYGAGQQLSPEDFYARVRAGAMPTTSQVNPEEARELLQKYVDLGYDVLHVAFTSGLSGTYNNLRLASEEINDELKENRVIVVDSLCASLGEGLLVYYAVKNKEAGMTMEENAKWLEEHKLNIVHSFTVDDLNHLYRGGRVSRTAAFFGTLASIKPVMHVDNEGRLIAIGKVRGRKKSLQALVDYMDEHIGSFRGKQDIFFISHGDCQAEAEYVADLVRNRFGIENCIINQVGPTIGSHSGPGTMALFFLGDIR